MEWIGLKDKQIFVKLRNGDVLNGMVMEVDDSVKPLIWITILDKFDQQVTIVHSEIVKLEVKK